MGTRSQLLADRVEQGAQQVIAFAEGLSDAEWRTVCTDDGRTVGVLVHHIASALLPEIELFMQLAAGRSISGVTWPMVDDGNAKHAREHAAASKGEAIELLQRNSAAAAAAISALSDEQLDRAAPVSLHGDAPLTTQFFIENHPLAHAYRHLASMRAAVGRKS